MMSTFVRLVDGSLLNLEKLVTLTELRDGRVHLVMVDSLPRCYSGEDADRIRAKVDQLCPPEPRPWTITRSSLN
jgi:hypothetical protein